eukprot:TRINITY_DN30774_c0_g1_i1.p1 TRINITY_DN30774_c0_g1~~TRINITY_DN30774_c0_g1_i1.p1  ORF type:complete len:516 (+),score=137.03 TRINITY_DN30774_c0_g1_i1:53-1549(+)
MKAAVLVCAAGAAALDPPGGQRAPCATAPTKIGLLTCGRLTADCVHTIPAASFRDLTPECLSHVHPSVFSQISELQLASIPPHTVAAMTRLHCGQLPADAVAPMSSAQCAQLSTTCFTALTPDSVQALQPECISEVAPKTFAQISPDQAKGLSKGGVDGLTVEQMRSVAANSQLCGSFDSNWVRMIDPYVCGELTTGCWSLLDTGLQSLQEECLLRLTPATLAFSLSNDGNTDPAVFCGMASVHKRMSTELRQAVPVSVCGACSRKLSHELFPQCPAATAPAPAKATPVSAEWESAVLRVAGYKGSLGIVTTGTKVASVTDGSVGYLAGVRAGMTVVIVNGVPTQSASDLTSAFMHAPPDFDVTVLRPKVTAPAQAGRPQGAAVDAAAARPAAGVAVNAAAGAAAAPATASSSAAVAAVRTASAPAQRLLSGKLLWQQRQRKESALSSFTRYALPTICVAAAAFVGYAMAGRSSTQQETELSVGVARHGAATAYGSSV